MSFILLGLIQGLTEFFPVSSSGHLVISKSFCEICDVDDKVLPILFLPTYYKDIIVANNDLIGDLLRGISDHKEIN
ncbi:MAG: undecaprenyl-diphosphate phosphatase [Candidatus Atribacteria bacterium]|nr:undecaprenyl-diphosphate phosphatase [Candidatus Atribacteria bacterium]